MRLVKVLRVIVEISNIDDLTLINLSPHDKTITACCLCAKGRGGLICHNNIAESLSWCLVGTFSEFFLWGLSLCLCGKDGGGKQSCDAGRTGGFH